jgi:hypothetical protein
MLQEGLTGPGHSNQASYSTIYQWQNQGNILCGHIVTIGDL